MIEDKCCHDWCIIENNEALNRVLPRHFFSRYFVKWSQWFSDDDAMWVYSRYCHFDKYSFIFHWARPISKYRRMHILWRCCMHFCDNSHHPDVISDHEFIYEGSGLISLYQGLYLTIIAVVFARQFYNLCTQYANRGIMHIGDWWMK